MKRKSRIWYWGPFELYSRDNNYLSICLTRFSSSSWGWEWGYRDRLRIGGEPLIEIRIDKLVVFYFERWAKGFEIHFLGFWWIR